MRRPELQPTDPQLKSQLLETLRHLNRGFGVALAAFDRLQKQDHRHKPNIFPHGYLRDHRVRTEALQAEVNSALLSLFAGREEQEADRIGRLPSLAIRKRV